MTRFPGRFVLALALFLPPLAWMTFEFGLAATLRPACAKVAWLGPIWGAGAAAACLLALAAAVRAMRDRPGGAGVTGRWMARVALIGAGVFALAILFQTLATFIVPPCAR